MRQTLEGFEGVENVLFISDKEQFEVKYNSDVPKGEAFRASVKEIIILPGVRKFLGNIGDQLNNYSDEGP